MVQSNPHAERIHSAGGKMGAGGKATMAGPHAQRISSMGGKVGGLGQAG